MWRCLNCGEESDDNFDVCWNCQTERDENSPRLPNPIEPVTDIPSQQSSQRPALSRMELALSSRYKDAYLVSKVMVGIGKLIKVVGVVLAVLIFFAVFALTNLALGNSRGDTDGAASLAVLLIGAINGFIVGFIFYIIGVIVTAIGQGLKAILDNTVGNSPFLTTDLKAQIMSLPKA